MSSILGGLGLGGGIIGKAIVQLELDSKKYAAEMEAAHAQTTASTSKLGGTLSKFSGFASTAYLAVGAAAVAGLGLSVKAALDAQRAQAALHNTIENAPQLAASAEKRFLALAESIRKTTGADDEAVISGIALQGNMGLTEKAINKLTPLVVDLAAKYDIDLQSAFKAVGKAATGSTGALSRYVGTIEKGATPAETLQNVLTKLGGAAGFAATQAKNEPWRLLMSDLEETAEDIGTALLPALRDLAEMLRNLLPLLKFLAQGLADIVQGINDVVNAFKGNSNGFDEYSDKLEALSARFKDGRIDILEYQHGLNELKQQYGFNLNVTDEYIALLHDQRQAIELNARRGAFMADRLKDVSKATEKVSDDFEFATVKLDDLATATKVSDREFEQYFRHLDRQSRDLKQTARELRDEKWINQDFIDFLSTKGPEWLIAFGNQNETQQKRWQEDWERSNERTRKANENLGNIQDSLDRLDKSNTKHTVQIKYEYVNFDPTKPGMSHQQK